MIEQSDTTNPQSKIQNLKCPNMRIFITLVPNQRGVYPVDGKNRKDIRSGVEVDIVLKKDQRTGRLTRGVVKDILTKSTRHPHGIKVRLTDGQVGRVKRIFI
jgi:uncharacterized repeat protein (TIGR03833 family)